MHDWMRGSIWCITAQKDAPNAPYLAGLTIRVLPKSAIYLLTCSPLDSRDSAILRNLPVGVYTVSMQPNGATGVGVVGVDALK